MHPWLTEVHAREHRRDLQRQADQAALVRAVRAAGRPRRAPHPGILAPLGRRLGVLMIRVGGRLTAHRRPEPAPCPWCDLAFPSAARSGQAPAALPPSLACASPGAVTASPGD